MSNKQFRSFVEPSKKQQEKAVRRERGRRAQRNRQLRSIGLITLAAVLVVGGLIWQSTPRTPAARQHPMAQGTQMGAPDALILIEEFADFQCIFCKRFFDETEQALVDAYVATGQVRFVYRTFGDWEGTESQTAAEAAYCAADQGKFWEYHDYLFTNYSNGNSGGYSTERLNDFAGRLGLDTTSFNECLFNGTYQQQVTADRLEGQQRGVQGTPTFFINGQIVEGAVPFETFQQYIKAILAAAGQ